ncbi:hypothetical protein GGI02_003527 [Coemansia sp. RSA 2322]|nr:hypothetical protein GGI02_003527 [Coemansia sp. RSA 2322]
MPDRTSSQVSEDKPELRRSDILSFLSRARTSVVPESQATASSRTLSDVNVDMASSNTRLQRSATDEVGSNGLSVAENDGVSPISQPHWPARSRPGARTHDAGDSIMELFTPERNKPAQLPTAAPNRSAGGEQPSSLAHTLVAQLLERHGNKAAVSAGNLAPGAGTASFVAPKSLPRHRESIVSNQRPESPESAGVHKPPPTAPLGAREDRGFSASSLPAPLASSSRAHDGDMKPPTLPDCLPPAPKRVCLADQQLQPPVPEPSAAALGGLGAIGSSVLHNLLADALAPLREQIRGEIRNLHVDMIRQGFVYQEQVRALRQECSEARELRQELELLRRENEQLRRHVPFFSLPTESALPESQGATRP